LNKFRLKKTMNNNQQGRNYYFYYGRIGLPLL
jgi:hypothetical protein